MKVIDIDQHLFEGRTTWAEHMDPGDRDGALSIEDDDLGYPWVTWKGKHLYLAENQRPGKASELGAVRQRIKRGEKAEHSFDEIPDSYWDPTARLKVLDGFGIDEAVMFPNFGLLWEHGLADDMHSLCANMRAANRWMAAACQQGHERLHGVAHLTLRNRDWVIEEIKRISKDGLRLAMTAPAPVDGVALSHESLDPVWEAFASNGVAPIFHVGGFLKPFHPAWYQADPEPIDKVLDSALLYAAPAVALGNMIVHGVFDRHPSLRVGVIEMTAHWVPEYMMMLEGAYGFYKARHGEGPTPLLDKPSQYFRNHVRVGVMAYEQPARLIGLAGEDIYMFGSDWPHSEGLDDPVNVTKSVIPDLSAEATEKLFARNGEWLLGVR
ncbi:MAG: amidohydrolase family protein [Actinomycetota bacterium]